MSDTHMIILGTFLTAIGLSLILAVLTSDKEDETITTGTRITSDMIKDGAVTSDRPWVVLRHQKLLLLEPLIIRPERGDLIDHCTIDLAPGFQGDQAINFLPPKDWSGIVPINHCEFYSNTDDSVMNRVFYSKNKPIVFSP
jgi:hypothetical protein